MNRTDRLLAIVLELQARRTQRAEDLAATFEISKRTVYRDIQALCEAGVPVVAMPGRGYGLIEGYFLPPLQFTSDEAVMLLLGCEVVGQQFDTEYRTAAQGGARKIAGVLSDDLRGAVDDLRASLRFVAIGTEAPGVIAHLEQLRRAILRRQSVRIRYAARQPSADSPAERTVDPYGLAHVVGVWYLTGYCHERRGLRQFRVNRIDELVLLDAYFRRPPHFSMQHHMPPDDRTVVARVRFDPAVTRWVREARSFYVVDEEETPDGLLVTLRARQERDVVPWLLSWGRQVQVVEPESLRALLYEEATALLRNLQQAAA